MSEQMLFRIRTKERQVITKEIESWKPDHDMAISMRDLEDLIQGCLLDRDKDNSFIQLMLDRARTLNPEGLNQVNLLIRECCNDALETLKKLSDCVREAATRGFSVEHASCMARAVEDYRRWQEDTPELLLLNHAPVKEQLRQRIQAAIHSPASQSDWRDLFLEASLSRF